MSGNVLIVGGGMSGLMTASTLQAHDIPVTLFEKNAVVGGRMATDYQEEDAADYGVQFFSTRTDEFMQHVEKWIDTGVLKEWVQDFSDGSLRQGRSEQSPRYIATAGMQKWAEHIANSIDTILTNTRVTAIQHLENGWRVRTISGDYYTGDTLVLTIPAPLALRLVDDSGVALSHKDRRELERIQYAPSLCAVFHVTGDIITGRSEALQRAYDDFAWIVDNSRKGIAEQHLITIQASGMYSRQHWTRSDQEILAEMQAEVAGWLVPGEEIISGSVHRWHYALPVLTYPRDYLIAENHPNLIFAGDGFGGRGRLEGAALSGIATAHALIKRELAG